MKTVAVNQILKALSSQTGLLYAENRGKRTVGKITTFVGHDGAAGESLVGKLFEKEDTVVALPSRNPVIELQQPNKLATSDSHSIPFTRCPLPQPEQPNHFYCLT